MRDVTVKLLEWSGQNDFTLQDSLAKGTYGQIYLATHNRSGNDFVVKVCLGPLTSACWHSHLSVIRKTPCRCFLHYSTVTPDR